jgi:general secretion pathway protein I
VKRACRGFSLLEVLVAFVILALVLAVLMRIFSGALRNIGAAEGYSQAVAIAESKLAAIGVDAPLAEGSNAGSGNGYSWRIVVRREEAGAPVLESVQPDELYRVEVTVSWGEAPAARSVRFVTLRAAPGASS